MKFILVKYQIDEKCLNDPKLLPEILYNAINNIFEEIFQFFGPPNHVKTVSNSIDQIGPTFSYIWQRRQTAIVSSDSGHNQNLSHLVISSSITKILPTYGDSR